LHIDYNSSNNTPEIQRNLVCFSKTEATI